MKIIGCIILILLGAGFGNSSNWKDVWTPIFASCFCYVSAVLLLMSAIGLI